MICLSLTAPTVAEAVEVAAANAELIGAVELRLDLLDGDLSAAVREFPRRCDRELSRRHGSALPRILTVRRATDGGEFSGSEAERLELLRTGIEAGYDYVDLEEDLHGSREGEALAKAAGATGTRVIRSYHDTEGVPAALPELVRRLSQREEEIPKLAVTPRGISDLRRLLSVAPKMRKSNGILVGMGTVGIPTRLLAPRIGSFLTFCSAGNKQAAPGHLDPETLVGLYRHDMLGATTRLFGVIGNPVMHSKSPHFHNRVFAERGLDALYVPFHVDDVDEFFKLAEELPIEGVSVTIPHKAAVISHLREVDESVTATGACNTVVRGAAGGWRGVNTDVSGFLTPLQAARSVKDAAVSVVGAGGAARAVVYALAGEAARICVLNRTAERARRLAEELSASHGFHNISSAALEPENEELLRRHSDIIVQTTSVGMAPHADEDPLHWYEFSGNELVYDIIYTPEITRLLARARKAGCKTVSGSEMFRGQADEQARLFCELVSSA